MEEVDLSDQLLKRLKEEKMDALISVVGGRGLSLLYKLHRKGLYTVCIPRPLRMTLHQHQCPLDSTPR